MKTVVFLADGFEECEALIVVDILRRAGIETIMASITEKIEVESSRNVTVEADVLAGAVDFSNVDLIVLPGGRVGTENLSKNKVVTQKIREFAVKRMVAAICAAPSVLADLGLLDGRTATCHPDYEGKMKGAILTHKPVAVEDNIVTGQGLGATFEFAFTLVRLLVGPEMEESIKKAICY